MRNVLVIGYGNSLRSDDCVGIYAVRELKKSLERPGVEFVEVPQLQPELAERVAKSDLAVFLDAATDGISGEINYENVVESSSAEVMSHGSDPATLLATARVLYGKAPTALLATVAGECFGYGTKLSPEVEVSMKGMTKRVSEIIEDFLEEEVAAAG